MDLTRDALEFLAAGSQPNTIEVNGKLYADKDMMLVDPKLYADPINLSTLDSLIIYINTAIDDRLRNHKYFVVVNSPTSISLASVLDEDSKRETLVKVRSMLPDIRFDWNDKESFCISLASGFVPTDDRDTILQFLSSVKAESVADYGDDGISQRATVRTGVSGKQDVVVPNPVTLAPYRTFYEIDQPESKFIFRLKNEGKEIYCRLFEADGGAWKMDAMNEIKDYLSTFIQNPNVTVIA